jgi:hypothetical protein
MRMLEVHASYEKRVNHGNFEHVEASCYLKAQVETGDDAAEGARRLFEEAKAYVDGRVGATHKESLESLRAAEPAGEEKSAERSEW